MDALLCLMQQILKQEKSNYKIILIINIFRTIKWKKVIDESETFLDGGRIPCLLVENKVDLLEDNINEEDLNQFARDSEFIGCFYTSAKTGKNISESMEFLIKEIIKKIKDMEREGKDNEHVRDTLKLVNDSFNAKDSRHRACC